MREAPLSAVTCVPSERLTTHRIYIVRASRGKDLVVVKERGEGGGLTSLGGYTRKRTLEPSAPRRRSLGCEGEAKSASASPSMSSPTLSRSSGPQCSFTAMYASCLLLPTTISCAMRHTCPNRICEATCVCEMSTRENSISKA